MEADEGSRPGSIAGFEHLAQGTVKAAVNKSAELTLVTSAVVVADVVAAAAAVMDVLLHLLLLLLLLNCNCCWLPLLRVRG